MYGNKNYGIQLILVGVLFGICTKEGYYYLQVVAWWCTLSRTCHSRTLLVSEFSLSFYFLADSLFGPPLHDLSFN